MVPCLFRFSIPLVCVHIVCAFTFVPGKLSQCDNLTVTWTDGSPPFQLLMTPVFGTPRNVMIPPDSFLNGRGSFSIQLPFPQGQQMVLTMSDETGFGAGGSTSVLQVEAPHGRDCNTTDPGVAFSFELDSGLQQCRPYTFSDYSGAIQPVTIMGIIPGGTSFVLNPPVGPTNFTWTDNIAAGSSVIFIMGDAQGRAGGSSRVMTVASSDDTSCLNNVPLQFIPGSTPPTATPLPGIGSGAASTATSPSTRSSSAPTTASPSTESDAASVAAGPHTSIAVIIGCASGAFLLAALLVLGLLYLKRRRGWSFRPSFRGKFEAPTVAPYDYTPSTHSSAHKSTTHSFTPGSQHDANPPLSTASPDPHNRIKAHPQRSPHQHEPPQYHSSPDHNPLPQPPLSRITVHMDLEGHLRPTLRETEAVESPPQYSGVGSIPGAVGPPPARRGDLL